MLQKLIIKNYAIIDHLVLQPDGHLNTVTGETGAGKSIILGALSLILGERADTSVLINKQDKSVVEGYFDVKNNQVFRAALQAAELDDEEQCIIRREIAASGKSRAFINDTPVTLGVLNSLTSLLVDLHQQFDHMALDGDVFQVQAVDALAGNTMLLDAYKQAFTKHKKVKKQLLDYIEEQSRLQKEADYKQYLLDELVQASFKDNEIEDAAEVLKQLSHSEKIIQVLNGVVQAMDEGEQPLNNEIKRIAQQVQSISDVMPAVKPLQERLLSAYAELKDIAEELSALSDKVSLDPEKMEYLQQRVDIGYKLLKKHAVSDTQTLLNLQQQLETDLQASNNISNAIADFTMQEKQLQEEMMVVAQQLTQARKAVLPDFISKMNELLVLVGMPNARFDVHIKSVQPTISGVDSIDFLLDANKSGVFQPVQKAASGGEMSRIMLCIKSLTARALHLPTLIFDEVDTGISGEVARQVGMLLRSLAEYHQVICITHQPQVAAKGTRHFYVFKQPDASGKLSTQIRPLKEDERVLAIAKMIGGEQPSEAAMNNAKELVFA